MKANAGIALVSVLWGVALLSLLAGTFLLEARNDTKTTYNVLVGTQARILADGGIHRGIALIEPRRSDGSFLADGHEISFQTPIGILRVSIQDEGGKVDLNTAPNDLLIALLESVGAETTKARALADAIADWRDKDKVRRRNGAEDEDYQSAGYSYGAKDNLFDTTDELRSVFGMTDEIYQAVAPLVTVYSGKRGVDAYAASPLVLTALARGAQDQVSEFVKNRSQLGRQETLPPSLGSNAARRFFSNSSRQVFTIRATAEIGGGKFTRESVVRFRRAGTAPFEILVWRQSLSW